MLRDDEDESGIEEEKCEENHDEKTTEEAVANKSWCGKFRLSIAAAMKNDINKHKVKRKVLTSNVRETKTAEKNDDKIMSALKQKKEKLAIFEELLREGKSINEDFNDVCEEMDRL